MSLGHVERLRRARDLLAVKGFDTRETMLTPDRGILSCMLCR
jgi:uncharacterized protein